MIIIERVISEERLSIITQNINVCVVAKSKIMKGKKVTIIVIYFHIIFKKIDCSLSIKNEGKFIAPPNNDNNNKSIPISEGKVPLEEDFNSISSEDSFKFILSPLISSFSKM